MASAEKLKEIKDEYTSSLSDLTINSKPLINMLTMLAEDYMENASVIVQAVEEHLEKVRSEYKLPVLYLIDSIVKNVGHAYTTLFTQNIVANFCGVFEKVDERIRSQMFKLRQTWSEVFPAKKMYALDVRVNAIDPAWPIIAPPPTPSIHVNPKFFNKSAGTTAVTTPSTTTPVTTTAPVDATLDMRAKLISKQKELLELQQKKIELELLQAKVKLEEQQKQFAMAQKTQRKNSPTITTTASTTTLPSMKTMLTKPAVLSTVAKSSETKTSSSKQSTKVSSQVSQAFSTPKVTPPTTNGPRITPVNSALISASSRSVSRDPRLAAKQAIQQQQQQLQSTAPTINEKLDVKSSKSSNNEPVNIEKSDTKQKNNLEVSNKITKVTQPPNTASLSIKDPRLISSKVHGGNNIQSSNTTPSLGNKSGKSGSRTFSGSNSRTKESGIPISNNRNKSKSKQKGGKQSEQVANKVVDITNVNVNKFSKIKSSNDSLKIPRSSSMSRSPTKPKRKERNNSPVKKSPQSSSSSESPSTKRSPHSKHSKNRHTSNKYDVDMDICNSPSPTPPPPAPPSVGNLVESTSAASSTNKVDDKSFKDLKGSTKSRNYIRRNRDMSRSPDDMSPNKDVDLRVGGAPPEKQARLQSPIPPEADTVGSTLVPENNLKNSITDQIIRDVSVAASKDIDLRQLPPATVPALIGKKRSSTDKLEAVNPKKSKAEMFDVLFGNEDVDLRTLPPKMATVPPVQPPTPPPPVISSPTSSMNTEDWQKAKEPKSSPTPTLQHSPQRSSSPPLNTPNTHLATVRAKLANATNRDRLGRPLLYNKLPDDPKERKRTISTTGDVDLRRIQKPPPIKTDAAIKQFLQQVEEEHKSGKMSQAQYQNAVEQVITILERQKLRKAKRMESLNDSLDTSGGGGMNLSLQPISDDELSADYSEEDDELEKMSTKDVDDRQLHVITNLTNTPEVDKIDLTSPNSPYEKSNENPTIDLTRPSKDDREEQERDNRDRGRDRDRDERPPRSRRWDGGGNEPWNRQPIRSPWLHPPLGLMEKQNPYSTPWKSPFISGIPPLGGGISLHGPVKELLENRPNVAVGGFVQRPPVVRYGPRSASPPAIGSQTTRELPHADQLVIEYINNDSMRTINIDGNPTEIRYYGDTAITMKGDEAREITFQNGTRRITFGEKESYVLAFNDVAREVMIAGVAHRVRLGAPTRELYIDDKWYECFFGGPGIVIEIDREYRVVKLEGPPPQVKVGNKRSDLCVGRINLIINAKNIVPIFLDAKPQKFDIEGKIHTLRFVDALRTVLINEEPFKVDFGGLPKPIIVHNKKHFIRFTRLPPGIKPGYVDIKDMEGQRFAGSPPRAENENSMDRLLVPVTEVLPPQTDLITNEPALPMFGKRKPLDVADQSTATGSPDNRVTSPTPTNPVLTSNSFKNFNLDLLSSIITPAMAPSSNINASGYNTDLLVNSDPTNPSEIPGLGGIPQPVQALPPPPTQPQTPAIGLTAPPRSLEELTELIQKLQATGILSNVSETLTAKEPNPVEVQDNVIKPVDFAQPETLKAKQPAIISALYSGMQCSSCGVRFPPEHTMKYSRQHLDWHYRQNKKKKHSVRKANSRKWFYDVSDWIQFEEIEDLEEREKSWFENQQVAASGAENNGETAEETPEEIEIPSVDARSAGENPRCDVCYDAFDQFYNEEKEEWHLRMAIRVDDKLYHPLCYEDYKVSLLETEPLEESTSLIEIRDETDENTNEDDVKEIKEKEPEPVVIDDEEPKPEEINSDILPLLSTEENPDNETKASEDTKEQEEDVDDLDNSEQDVCIILPEEEIPIVKIDDTADDEDDVFKENESSNESTQNVVKHKMEEVVLADGSIVKIKSEPLDPDIDEPIEEIASTTADNSQISVQSSIDGNVQLDSTVNIGTNVHSGKIKINISKPLISSQSSSQSKEISDLSNSQSISESLDSSEPPPPGEEPPLQIKLKPALQGVNLKVMPPVSKGSELSGLCSIM